MPKILILTTKTPFISGGAELHAASLRLALLEAGHQVETIQYPFNYSVPGDVVRSMYLCGTEEFANLDAGSADLAICLKFPTYYVSHFNKVVWLLHQHRPVFDEWEGDSVASTYSLWMKNKIFELDEKHLRPLGSRLFTNSPNVSARLMRFQGIPSQPLYHPPPILKLIRHSNSEPFIFFPSRLEGLKRQSLLISAMALVKTPLKAVIAGAGGMHDQLMRMIEREGLRDRVQMLGAISQETLIDLYSRCLAVFYGPRDEDYGYVTLEAMLAKKPVITCSDSGGPVAFIENGRNGFVVNPDAASVAVAINEIASNYVKAYRMGQEGFRKYVELDITWSNVIEKLTAVQIVESAAL